MSLIGNRKLVKAMVKTGMDKKTAKATIKEGLAGGMDRESIYKQYVTNYYSPESDQKRKVDEYKGRFEKSTINEYNTGK